MNRMPLVLIAALAFSLPPFADEGVAAAQQAKLVTAVQAKLGVPTSGKLDAETEAAVKEFQRAKGIEPTGELDKRTVTALGMGSPKPRAPTATVDAKPTTPVGPAQSSAERTAEPTAKTERPTGD